MTKSSKIITFIRKKFQTDLPFPEQDLLAFWRERICFAVFLCALLFLIIPYALAVLQIIREGRRLFFTVYTLGYLLLLVISLARRRIPFKIRAWIGVSLFYIFGLLPLLVIGPVSSGCIYLFVFAILPPITIGVKAGLAALAVNICTIIVVGLLAGAGRLEWASGTPYAVVIWKNSLGNRSEKGANCQAVLMSIYRTLKRRGLNPIDSVVNALREYVKTGTLPPLPTSDG